MKNSPKTKPNESAYRQIPSIQELLNDPEIQATGIDTRYLKQLLEQSVGEIRDRIRKSGIKPVSKREDIRKQIIRSTLHRLYKLQDFQLKKVINGTGIILHTNLGRAPLADSARHHLFDILDHYCNLEIDLESGKRGDRTTLVEDIICLVTGAESALVVNNNAAAILLVLNTLCRRKEVPVSRGELVEIGGSFRMPEVMKAGMVKMVEIGTTNKTHLQDYTEAITPRTAGILKVHTSNYRVMGFTSAVSIEDLVNLANQNKIPLIYDMGSGVLEDLEDWGFSHEPVARDYVQAGVDVITFSADKVLGGPQAGIIIGKKKYVQKIKKNHLLRALRCDKLTYALLDATLRLYLQPEKLKQTLPVATMLNQSREELLQRGNILLEQLAGLPLKMDLVETYSQMGSGALPLEKIPAVAVSLLPGNLSVTHFSKALRENDPAIIGYIEKDAFFINLRTVRDDEIPLIGQKIRQVLKKS